MCSPGLNAVRKTVHAQCVPLLALHILQGGPSLCRKRVPVPQHAANCGARTNLLRCSRCHAVHFCGVKCQKVGRQRKTCALCTAKTWPRGLLGGRGLLGRPAVTGPRSRQGPLQSGGTCWGCMGDNRVCGHGFHSLDLGSMWGLALPGAGVWADSSSKPGPPSQPPPPLPTLQAYWPFHRLHCKRNEFADAMEEADPKFASWMRGHGKMAVLKDDEVDRLERATQAASGPGRHEVMESMYGRLDPKPQGDPGAVRVAAPGCGWGPGAMPRVLFV